MENFLNTKTKLKICIIGLGYVGLPLAVAFAKKKYSVTGFDINKSRVSELRNFYDKTGEIEKSDLTLVSTNLDFSNDDKCISLADIIIVSVPTPIKLDNTPDLEPLISATKIIAKNLKKKSVIVYESTVFPGATEEICVPIIQEISSFKFNRDFFVGYSPERINPGDKINKLENIKKVVSASNKETLETLEILYGDIIDAGIFSADSIKIAEASKITENIQRDVNIALINELHQIFSLMDIDTSKVIEAASTKWNFMKVEPGLVGGHCIGVDPHYMIYKSTGHGYVPNLMRNAREINEGMSTWVVNNFLQFCQVNSIDLITKKVTVLGYTFKKNCPDTRNTKVEQLLFFLKQLNIDLCIWDPWLEDQDKSYLRSKGFEVLDSEPLAMEIGFLCVKHDNILSLINESDSQVFDFTKTY